MYFFNNIRYASFLFLAASFCVFSTPRPLLRISVENQEDHIQTVFVSRFAHLLKERANGAIDVEFYHSGRLFRDQEVINALYTGKVEMAVPGTWHVSSFIPQISYFLLPDFFGEAKEHNYEYLDSEEGRQLIREIEESLHVVVPGLWMDLGHAVIFTTKRNKISTFKDFHGKTIRVAGGVMNKRRVELLGAAGVIIAWSEVPYHLKKGTIDGLLTTFETVKSAELWEYGVKYAFIDNEYFPQYVPLISRFFWESISPEIQKTIISTWNEVAEEQRIEAGKAQREALILAEKKGIELVYPQQDDLRKAKETLMQYQQILITEIMQEK